MLLTDFFRVIGAPDINPGATEAAILEADLRLGGRLPDALRNWFREADGFRGEAEENVWRFKSLERLRTIPDIFEEVQDITIVSEYGPAPPPANARQPVCHFLRRLNLPPILRS